MVLVDDLVGSDSNTSLTVYTCIMSLCKMRSVVTKKNISLSIFKGKCMWVIQPMKCLTQGDVQSYGQLPSATALPDEYKKRPFELCTLLKITL